MRLIRTNLTEKDVADVKEQLAQVLAADSCYERILLASSPPSRGAEPARTGQGSNLGIQLPYGNCHSYAQAGRGLGSTAAHSSFFLSPL